MLYHHGLIFRVVLKAQPVIGIVAVSLAATPAFAQTYNVSGYTFNKPQNISSGTASGQREYRAVRGVQNAQPDARIPDQPSPEEQAENQRRVWLQQEQIRIETNQRKLAAQLAGAASTPTIQRNVFIINKPTEFMIANRERTLEQAIEDPGHRVGALREQAREEWYWFSVNQYDLMWGVLGAALDPTGEQAPLDDTAREARDHLEKYLEIVRNLESITHTAEYAEKRYQQRMKLLTFARRGSYNVNVSADTAKTDIYPPEEEFHPWSEDELIRQGTRCTFDMAGECR